MANRNSIRGKIINNTPPTDGQALIYSSGTDQYVPTTLPGSSFGSVAQDTVLSGPVSGADAAPTFKTLTAVTDGAFGGTRGMIPYRGASTWAGLAVGSANTVLKSDGTDASWGTVGVAAGGTNLTSYTVGDLIYASGATTLAKLAAGATAGHVLTSNGSAAAPSWQAAAGGADTRWTTSGSNLYQTTTTDGVSIGTSTNAAASKLHVVGDGTRKHVTFTAGGADGCIDVIVAAGGSSLFRVLDDAGPLLTLRPGGSGTGVLDFRDSDDNARIGQLQWSVGDDAIGFFMTSGRQFEVWHGSTLNLQASSAGTSVGVASLATDATDGFIYVPACAGTPTGVPTGITGFAPIVVNTTNHKLYFYSGGSWRDAGP